MNHRMFNMGLAGADAVLEQMRKETKREVLVRDLHSFWIPNYPGAEKFTRMDEGTP